MLQHTTSPAPPIPHLRDIKKPLSPSTSTPCITKKPLPTSPRPLSTVTPRLPLCKEKQPLKQQTNDRQNNATASIVSPPPPPPPPLVLPSTPVPHHHQPYFKQAHPPTSSSSSLSPTSPNTLSPPMSPIHQIHSSSSMSLYSMGSEQLLDHSHLKPGDNASLLSYATTINMYRANAKKTNDMEIQCDFAIFLVEAAKRLVMMDEEQHSQSQEESIHAYLTEAEKLLKQIAIRGHSPSQYYLANMYSSGLLHKTRKFEFDKAFPLYVQAAKHHHPDAAYRTGKCYEDALGTRRDKAKAVQFYRKAATLNHPGAMYRLGLAEMRGELGLCSNVRDGHKWLKRSAEASTAEYPHALHELAHLHERGVASIIFQDHDYAVRLYQDASELGYAPSCFRLGECYEFGRLGCSVDPKLSMHYYGLAAEQGHSHACFALTAWYLIGVPGMMEPSDEQAFAWALRAAHPANGPSLARAEYAVGYFYEVGIGIEKNQTMAWEYYQKAAAHGEKRAIQRLKLSDPPPPPPSPPASSTPQTHHQAHPYHSQSTPPSSTPALTPPRSSSASSLSSSSSSSATQRRLSMQSTQQAPSDTTWVKKWRQKLSRNKSSSASTYSSSAASPSSS